LSIELHIFSAVQGGRGERGALLKPGTLRDAVMCKHPNPHEIWCLSEHDKDWLTHTCVSVYMCARAFVHIFCVTCVSEGTSLEEQVRRIKDIEAIESDSFVPQAFKSSRDEIKTELPEVKQEPERAYSQDVTLPTSIVYSDTDTLAHPSLFLDKEKAEELWLLRLISLRQERLMGSPVP
uniref:Arginine and serine rich coiled-coil 1 n=1 Tax=Pundamilia nyererei TaxID=303518 RepID=A0A3B4GLJ6_9CICH